MAPWNELVLACNLKRDIPQQVIDVLNYLIAPSYDAEKRQFVPISTPDHPFFKEPDWEISFGSHTAYFPGDSYAIFTDITSEYKLTLRALVRKGDARIEAFLQWIAPYSITQGFVGYTRCDETELSLDLIYFEEGVVYFKSIAFYNDPPTIETVKISKSGED